MEYQSSRWLSEGNARHDARQGNRQDQQKGNRIPAKEITAIDCRGGKCPKNQGSKSGKRRNLQWIRSMHRHRSVRLKRNAEPFGRETGKWKSIGRFIRGKCI